jgi:hypothetical protein
MKIFIVGPEGAGKTVFAAALNDWLSGHPECGLVFRAGDLETKRYIETILLSLRRGEWPSLTGPGRLVELSWEIKRGSHTSRVNLIDAPGHDIRQELCGNTKSLGIINRIKEADLLIMLVDLVDHQFANDDKRIENAWIVENFLRMLEPKHKTIFALTKADLLTGSLQQANWNNRIEVVRAVQKMMPELNVEGYRCFFEDQKNVILAFSSVSTCNKPNEQEELIRFPRTPIESIGIERIVETIRQTMICPNCQGTGWMWKIVWCWRCRGSGYL